MSEFDFTRENIDKLITSYGCVIQNRHQNGECVYKICSKNENRNNFSFYEDYFIYQIDYEVVINKYIDMYSFICPDCFFLKKSLVEKFVNGRGALLRNQLNEDKNKNIQEQLNSDINMEDNIQMEQDDILKDFFDNVEFEKTEAFDVTGQIDIKIGSDIDVINNVKLKFYEEFYNKKMTLSPDVYLVSGEGENLKLVGIFTIKKVGKEYFLTCNKDDYNFDDITNNRFTLFFKQKNVTGSAYHDKKKGYKKNIEINYHDELETTKSVLCIDFGTSNSTAGTYLPGDYISKISQTSINNKNVKINEINYVKFPFTNKEDDYDCSRIVPTMVYVEDCKDEKKIKYLFGYEAAQKLRECNFCPTSSCLLEIKRWTNYYHEKINIEDSAFNTATVTKGEIIRQYLLYIIKQAELQFNCRFKDIHITTPVKLKSRSLKIYAELLKENGYNVIQSDKGIDEGVAVLYELIDNEISTITDNAKKDNAKKEKALIMDCGGGTTDIASCEYEVEKDSGMIDLTIKTQYINGDVNFGGNNLTYRIMQYMKICYANYYNNSCKFNIDNLITTQPGEIFALISEDNAKESKAEDRYKGLYEEFDKQYEMAEKIIPTKYAESSGTLGDEKLKVKNNFYFLWKIAEQMKEEFFRNTNVVLYGFCANDNQSNQELHIEKVKNWPLSIRENEKLVPKEMPDIQFSTKEIEKLLQGDIYYLVHKFLNPLFLDNSLSDYQRIKLSGQSTQIVIFQDSLKEFLPGRKIKRFQGESNLIALEEKKLSCVTGAIKYINNKRYGKYDVTIVNETKCIPVDAYCDKNAVGTQVFFSREKGWSQKPVAQRITEDQPEFIISSKTQDGVVVDEAYKYNFDYENNKEKSVDMDEIKSLTNFKDIQSVVDKLKADKWYIIVSLNEKDWGFNVLPIKKSGAEIYVRDSKFFSFDESGSSSVGRQNEFFDGLK